MDTPVGLLKERASDFLLRFAWRMCVCGQLVGRIGWGEQR